MGAVTADAAHLAGSGGACCGGCGVGCILEGNLGQVRCGGDAAQRVNGAVVQVVGAGDFLTQVWSTPGFCVSQPKLMKIFLKMLVSMAMPIRAMILPTITFHSPKSI